MIADDEDNHLAYCHEELLRLARAGPRPRHPATLRACALAEIRVYREVSLAVMDHMGRILGWSARQGGGARRRASTRVYAYERLGGWRRMVCLAMPERRDALGGPAPRPRGVRLSRPAV